MEIANSKIATGDAAKCHFLESTGNIGDAPSRAGYLVYRLIWSIDLFGLKTNKCGLEGLRDIIPRGASREVISSGSSDECSI